MIPVWHQHHSLLVNLLPCSLGEEARPPQTLPHPGGGPRQLPGDPRPHHLLPGTVRQGGTRPGPPDGMGHAPGRLAFIGELTSVLCLRGIGFCQLRPERRGIPLLFLNTKFVHLGRLGFIYFRHWFVAPIKFVLFSTD